MSYKEIRYRQQQDKDLQRLVQMKPTEYRLQIYQHSDQKCELITKEDKIVLPENLQQKATEWHHTHLLHQGESRMEFTMGKHYCWKGMRATITKSVQGLQHLQMAEGTQ